MKNVALTLSEILGSSRSNEISPESRGFRVNCVIMFVSILGIGQTSQPALKWSKDFPRLLERAFLQRSDFKTGRFNLRVEFQRQNDVPRVQTLDVRMAGENWLIRNFGNDDGIVHNPMAGQQSEGALIGVGGAFLPVNYFMNWKSKEQWSYQDGGADALYSENQVKPDYVDLRTYGLRAIVLQRQDPRGLVDMMRKCNKIDYSEKRLGDDLVRVSGLDRELLRDGSFFEYEWDIDTSKGPAVLEAREFLNYSDGRRTLAVEAKNHLALIDAHWWPLTIEVFVYPTARRYKVEFRKVEINRPEHPSTLTPDALELPVGLPVRKHNSDEKFYYIGGGVVVDEATWDATKTQVDLAPLEAFKARNKLMGRGEFPPWWNETDTTFGLDGVADRPDLWEAYVRRWVLKRVPNRAYDVAEPLTAEQKAAAQGILDDCRKKATPIRAKLDVELTKVVNEIKAREKELGIAPLVAAKDTASDEKAKLTAATPIPVEKRDASVSKPAPVDDPKAKGDKRLIALRERRAVLEHPPEVQRLFDELKRRLDGLLTSKQRDPGSITRRLPPKLPQH